MNTQFYNDFDAFVDDVRGVDCQMMLVNPKNHRWSISHTFLPEIHVQLGRLGSGNILEGQSQADGYLIYLPLTDACEYRVNGAVLGKSSFMILEPGSEFSLSTKDEHDWCTIVVPSHMLARSDDSVEPSPGSKEMTSRVTLPDHKIANRFATSVRQIIALATHCPKLESSPAAMIAAAQLAKIASSIVGIQEAGKPRRKGRPSIPRKEILRRASELLEASAGKHIRAEDLSVAAGVSERTLRDVFGRHFGVGPARFLQLRQLHRVHRALRAASSDEVSVTEILISRGEWEFGRFASRYRQLFGELPSETLKTRRQ